MPNDDLIPKATSTKTVSFVTRERKSYFKCIASNGIELKSSWIDSAEIFNSLSFSRYFPTVLWWGIFGCLCESNNSVAIL